MDVDYHPKSNQIAAASADSSVHLWQGLANNENVRAKLWPFGCGSGVAFRPVTPLASCSKDKTVRLWVNGIEGRSTDSRLTPQPLRSVAFSPDSRNIVTASDDKSIKYGVSAVKFVKSMVGHANWVRCASFSAW